MRTALSNQGVRSTEAAKGRGTLQNKIHDEDRAAHDWFRFVLSFPPHLVRDYVRELGFDESKTVLDPFCGTGTTVVECRKLGIPSVGIEANPMAFFATSVKVDWGCDPKLFLKHAHDIADSAAAELSNQGIQDIPFFASKNANAENRLRKLPAEAEGILLKNSISPLPLHKTLVLLDAIERHPCKRHVSHAKLALANVLVRSIGNLHFGPEVGVGKRKPDAPVISAWLAVCKRMATDLCSLRKLPGAPVDLHRGDSRRLLGLLKPNTIDGVITSPPYPNEKDYTRTTRLESVILGFLRSKRDLREMKQNFLRSNTRNVYKGDDDDQWVAGNHKIQEIARRIESRRAALGKTSGFERLYHRVTKLYFGGMKRHLSELATILRPGARLAYVVGDQASYLRVMIHTGELLAEIATSLGYELVRIDLFRKRLATATRNQLREEIVVLRWPGKSAARRCRRIAE